jgi:hypothetical protein
MENEIDDATRGFTAGAYPNLSLPVIIMSPGSHNKGLSDWDKKPSATKKRMSVGGDGMTDAPEWWMKNPSLVSAWSLPVRKNFFDFFNTRNSALKSNLTDFPKFKHHKKNVSLKPLCTKYQTAGKCRDGCPYAHVPPSNMDPMKKAEVSAQLLSIYS